ncbi:hypothetical protein C8F01DRAFT_786042 [Mycena amicta]|nr:hypothetical protein C8F01DRAFT_786042 [Mycena amicta]
METLEIEDDDARLQRIQNALEKLNASGSARGDIANVLGSSRTSELGTGNDEHLKDLLARVQGFLPQMEASNAAVAQKAAADPRSVDIENVDGDEEVVQMNLGLGVFEKRIGREAESSSESDDSDMSTDSDTSDDSSSSGSTSDSSTQPALAHLRNLTRPIRPLPKRARGPPEIVVLSESTLQD